MPPSGRAKAKTRARKGNNVSDAAQEPSDIEVPEVVATPTRSSRKRTRGAAEVPTQPARNVRRKVKDVRSGMEREDTEGTEAQDGSDNETQPAVPSEQEIIASLKVAERQVNATEDFANDLLEGQENVPGYGKIAGRDWAFIIRKVEVNIGRPEAHERLNGDGEPVQASASASAKTVVDIDLGPDRQVSRSHAIIAYDGENASWYIIVNGRNGLRVDNNLLRRGTKSYLRNGSVIDIAGTQMAFITSAAEDSDGPVWDGSIIRQAQKSSEEDEEGEDDTKTRGPDHAHLRRGTLQDSSSRLPPEYNANGNGSTQQRNHPHSSRANDSTGAFPQPGTPVRSALGTNPFNKSSPNANYARGITMESTESIDYSSNAAKDLKPPHSYAQLIGMAILSTSEQQMTLSNIYKWIMANYAFYRFNTGGWQNSIRHNLSLNKAFVKIARRTDEPGKGMKWMIEPTEFENFVGQGMKGCRRPPLQGLSATQTTLPEASSPLAIRHNKAEATPPMPSFRASQNGYDVTPENSGKEKLSNGHGLGIDDTGAAAETLDFLRTTPRNGVAAAAAASPQNMFVPEDGRVVNGMDTPFPLKPTQRMAPPSTLRRPSDFIQFSSPAPFWKMEGLVGNTPWKFDVSPAKTPFAGFNKSAKAEDEKNDEDKKSAIVDGEVSSKESTEAPQVEDEKAQIEPERKQSPNIPSSSPPRPNSAGLAAAIANGSPTAIRPASRLASVGVPPAKGLNLLAAATREAEKGQINDSKPFDGRQSRNAVPAPPQQLLGPPMTHDDGEDEGIDLVKGFQPIGTFHHQQRYSLGAVPLGAQPVGLAPGRASFGR